MENKLSELEACVLGLVYSEGPCTPYQVHRLLSSSPSPHWSGSAGAVYPVFKRLQERRLVQGKAVRKGKREGREFRLSDQGTKALRHWLGPPLPDWIADLPIDPLRTRLRFLGALPPKQQSRFVDQARQALQANLEKYESDCRRLRKLDDPYPHAMARGAVKLGRARLQWLAEVAKMLEEQERA